MTQTLVVGETWTLQLFIRRGDMPFIRPRQLTASSSNPSWSFGDLDRSLRIRAPVTARRYLPARCNNGGGWSLGVARPARSGNGAC